MGLNVIFYLFILYLSEFSYANKTNENFKVIENKTCLNCALLEKIETPILTAIQDLKYNRPFFAGSGATLPPRVKPGNPWPSRPQDYEHFSVTTKRTPQIVDRFPEITTNKNKPATNNVNTVLNENSDIPQPNRPSFAGSVTTLPPRVKPGKPWPSKPVSVINPLIVDRFQETTTEKNVSNLGPNLPNRPFFAGSGTTLPPRVKPGKPWPSRPEDYINFNITTNKNPQIVDRFGETTTNKNKPGTIVNTILSASNNFGLNENSDIPKPNRPPFAGSATTLPPKVKPGKPLPFKPVNNGNFDVISPLIVDRFHETTSEKNVSNLGSNLPNRPPFAGSATTLPPRVKPGKPWPSRPEDYGNFNVTTNKNPQIVDRFGEITTNKNKPGTIVNTILSASNNFGLNENSDIPKPNRPPFAGSVTTLPPRVEPGKPWPSKPENNGNFSVISPLIVDRFQETTTEKNVSNLGSNSPNRPSFAGSATTLPPRVKPGKPWPSSPEDYGNFNVTTNKNPQIVDRFGETTTNKNKPGTIVNTILSANNNFGLNENSDIPKPNRPPFAGSVTTLPPRVEPGQPWPSKPENNGNFSVISPLIVDRFQETTTEKNVSNLGPNSPNRPSFAGSVTTLPPRVKPGKPWPSRPENNGNFSVINRFQETTTEKNVSNLGSNLPNRPFFAGSATTLPPKVNPGKPWSFKPENNVNFSVLNPLIVDRTQEITTKHNKLNSNGNLSNRPFFTNLPPKLKLEKPCHLDPKIIEILM